MSASADNAMTSQREQRRETEPGVSEEQKLALAANGILNNCWAFVAGIVAFIVTPVLLNQLGASLFGVWTTLLAVLSVAALLDCGVSFVVIRIVAAGWEDPPARAAVSAAFSFYVLLGIAAVGLLTLLGPRVSEMAGLKPEPQGAFPVLFALSLAFVGEQLSVFAFSVFAGRQQFRALASLSSAGSVIKGCGLLWLAWRGASLAQLLMWYAAVSVAMGILAVAVSSWSGPGISLQLLPSGWVVLLREWKYALITRFDSLVGSAIWQGPLLLIAAMSGPAAVAEYRIGQRLPSELASIAWRSSEVFFPAASEYAARREGGRLHGALFLSTRWMLLLTLPVTVAFLLLAPQLLHAWLGAVPPGTSLVMRITALAIAFGAVGNGADNMLMGEGRAKEALAVAVTVAVITLAAGGWMLHRWGVAGFAAATVIAWTMSAVFYLALECRSHKLSLVSMLWKAGSGLALPLFSQAAVILLVLALGPRTRWWGALLPLACGFVAYGTVLLALNQDERWLARHIWKRLEWRRSRPQQAVPPVPMAGVDEVFHRNSDI